MSAALGGRYQVERELGRGGTATVYLAQDLRHGRRVAVKVLYPELAASVGSERFLREVEIAARLTHPHILPLYDSGEADGLLYFVMPYVEGESLRHRLRREIQMPVEEAVRIAHEVAGALSYAHQCGIVHRDIKPENILLEGDQAVVADFGVARAIETASSDRLTETGLAVGTPAYMSPEQAAGTGRVDGRSDIYSLGCVLFEMLAGEPPFAGGTQQAIVAKHMQAPVPDLRVVRPTVTPQLRKVVLTALAKVPADRFATAEKFAEALEGTMGEARAPFGVRTAITVVLAAILSVALGTWLFRGGREWRETGYTADEATSEPRRIAVLYFDNQSGDSALAPVADRVTEELIYELSGVNGFRVISRNGVRPYRDRHVPFDSLVTALRANIVVDGSLSRSGDRIRARAQMIDARSNTYLDSLSFEWPAAESETLERGLAQELAAGLRRQMGKQVRLRMAGTGSRSRAATEFARKAQRDWEDGIILAEQNHPRDLATALDLMGEADSLLRLAQLADSFWPRVLIDRGWIARDRSQLLSGEPRMKVLQDGLRLADEAVRRAPDNPAALELRGVLRWLIVTELQTPSGDPDRIEKAEGDLRKALDHDSTRVRAWSTLSYLLMFKGNTAEAELASEKAAKEDTYLVEARSVLKQLFFNNLMLGQYSQARQWCRRGQWSFPGNWRFVQCELTLMQYDADAVPMPDSAWKLVKVLEQLDPPEKAAAEGRQYHTIYRRIVAATISARAGRRDIARAEIARARRATAADSTLRLDLASDEANLRLVLGERDRAIRLLQSYIEARPLARDYLARDPLFQWFKLPASPGVAPSPPSIPRRTSAIP